MEFQTHGVRVYYQEQGQGKPVLLLHGWGGNADSFAPVYQFVSKKAHAYAIDFPAHGRSETPKEPWCVDDFAQVTLAFIEKMNIRGCDVIAHSFGARVVLKLAAADPTLFSRIVLTGGAGIRPKRGFSYYWRVYTFKCLKKMARARWICSVAEVFGVDLKSRTQNAGSEEYRALPDQMKRTFSQVVNEDLTGCLAQIRNSTLLIWGTEDTATPLWMGELMEQKIPDSGLIRFDGCGHFAYLDRLPQFLAIIDNFLLSEETA